MYWQPEHEPERAGLRSKCEMKRCGMLMFERSVRVFIVIWQSALEASECEVGLRGV